MFSQLNELKTIGGVERLNFSIEFLQSNNARVVITSQINSTADSQLAEVLKRPIVVTGSLSDLDMMLTNEIFNFSTEITQPNANKEKFNHSAQPEIASPLEHVGNIDEEADSL
ncbi:hypothetical protein [Shewanella sp. UCD-KL12]|uniref:hypothetical protein n=1 Tax=Shewanella sp. UCD-KL12 TaxID=1917163 RepID=UPI0009714895|nr:hypothetical protein [Shewanella sp. UCD-KL12]